MAGLTQIKGISSYNLIGLLYLDTLIDWINNEIHFVVAFKIYISYWGMGLKWRKPIKLIIVNFIVYTGNSFIL